MREVTPSALSAAPRDELGRHREPFLAPLDVAALVMIILMIWGPLVAGALRP